MWVQGRKEFKTIDQHLAGVEIVGKYGCWRLPNKQRPDGYVYITVRRKRELAHRMVFKKLIGRIPKSRPQLDHLCRHRWCCHPNHVEPVTNQTNAQRGNTGKHLIALARARRNSM